MKKRGNIFKEVQMKKPRGNVFNLDHERKLSTVMGRLTPIMVMDCVPGDKVTLKPNVMLRFAPMLAPIMHRVNVFCHFFFVPNRLMYEDWEDFITGGETSTPSTAVAPYLELDLTSDVAVSSLGDYLGLPTDGDVPTPCDVTVSALPFYAYQLIYHEYYRDQNLQPEDLGLLPSGDATAEYATLSQMRYRAWTHDYFTSALPFTQKGPEALLPITGRAPVTGYTDADVTGGMSLDPTIFRYVDTGLPVTGTTPGTRLEDRDLAGTSEEGIQIQGLDEDLYLDLKGNNYADLDGVTQTSINDFRRSMALQAFLEMNARGGTRYSENILAHFGVRSSDARLQRPEYIGGVATPVRISEVLQTSESTVSGTPQGTMAGHGVSVGAGGYASYRCEEHGYIMGIMSVMPVPAYQQGINRHWLRRDRFDYYWPAFAHIGEQPIMNQELFAGHLSGNEATFGYTPRYAEYKFMNSSVHGDFRTTLDFWHLGRKFDTGTPPNLNSEFIQMLPEDVVRIFAVQDSSDNLWCHVINEVKAYRLMPVFSTPSTL